MGMVYECRCILFCDISMSVCSIAFLILALHVLWEQYLDWCCGLVTGYWLDVGKKGIGESGILRSFEASYSTMLGRSNTMFRAQHHPLRI